MVYIAHEAIALRLGDVGIELLHCGKDVLLLVLLVDE